MASHPLPSLGMPCLLRLLDISFKRKPEDEYLDEYGRKRPMPVDGEAQLHTAHYPGMHDAARGVHGFAGEMAVGVGSEVGWNEYPGDPRPSWLASRYQSVAVKDEDAEGNSCSSSSSSKEPPDPSHSAAMKAAAVAAANGHGSSYNAAASAAAAPATAVSFASSAASAAASAAASSASAAADEPYDDRDRDEQELARKEWLQYYLQVGDWKEAGALVVTKAEREDLEYLQDREEREARAAREG